MKKLVAAAALIAGLSFGASAMAATPITATLAAPVEKASTVVAAGAAWRCAETTCQLASDTTVETYSACRAIARQVGAVTAIGSENRMLSDERLAKCNASAKK